MRFATCTGTNPPVRRRQPESTRKKDGRKRITLVLIVESSNNARELSENSGNGIANINKGPRPAAMLSDMNDRERLRGVILFKKRQKMLKKESLKEKKEGKERQGDAANAKEAIPAV